MIIRSLKKHWPARKLEWIMAGVALSWGTYALTHPAMFTSPVTEPLLRGLVQISEPISKYPALVWGGLVFLMGLIRAAALFVNGAYYRTPLIRTLTSFVSMFLFTQIFIGLVKSGVPNFGVVVYPWLVIADLISAFRAAVDVVHAEKQREVEKENRRARTAARFTA